MKRGFTVVELLITMVVMVILMTLGVFSMRSVQANARDSERQADVETIARGLEQYYERGNSRVKTYAQDPVGGYTTKGMYPGAIEFTYILGRDWCSVTKWMVTFNPCVVSGGFTEEALPGVSAAAMTPPGKTKSELISSYLKSDTDIQNDLQSNKYVYKPLSPSGTNCNGGADNGNTYECPSFILMYIKETSSSAYPGNVVTIKSKHQ